jgi:hypothetical protein
MGESMLPRAKAERRGFYRGFSSQSRRELGQAPGYHLKMLPRLYCVSVGERGGGFVAIELLKLKVRAPGAM